MCQVNARNGAGYANHAAPLHLTQSAPAMFNRNSRFFRDAAHARLPLLSVGFPTRTGDREGLMTFFQVETEINASAELVWTTMRDVERWPEWTRR